MTAIDMTLGDHITLKQLARAIHNGFSPIVEVESMDGIYKVRFHHANGVSDLTNAEGHVSTFLGPVKFATPLDSWASLMECLRLPTSVAMK